MAENKKKVIVYSGWIEKFEALEDVEAGKLIKHFFRYINDLNPKYPDRITELSFIDIKSTLKRDLVKWDKKAENSRENGKQGGRPPNPIKPTITQQVNSEPKEPVNVNVNDNVNDNVNVNVNEQKKTTEVGKVEKTLPPTEVEFLEYCKKIKEFDFKNYEYALKAKYESWINAGWKDGNNKKIINWKSKIKVTYSYLKPMQITKSEIKQVSSTNYGTR